MSQIFTKVRTLVLGACILPWMSGTDLSAAIHQSKAGETKNVLESDRRLVRLGSSSTMEQHSEQHFTLKSGTALIDSRRKFGARPVKVSLKNHQVTVGAGTCMVEYQEGGYVKVVCISGKVLLRTTAILGEFVELKAGQMSIFNPMETVLPVSVEINLERFIHTTRLLNSGAKKLPGEKNLAVATAQQKAQFDKGVSTKTALVIHGKGTEVSVDGTSPKKGKPARANSTVAEAAPAQTDTKLAGTLASFVAVEQAMASTLNMTSFHMALSGAQSLLGIGPMVAPLKVVEEETLQLPPTVNPEPTPSTPPLVNRPRPPAGNGGGGGSGGGGSGGNGSGRPPHIDPSTGYWEINSNTKFSSSGLITQLKEGASLQLPRHTEAPSDTNKIAQRLTFVGTNDFSALGPKATFYSDNSNGGLTFGHYHGRSTTTYRYGSGDTVFAQGPSLNLAARDRVSLYHTDLLLGHGSNSHLGVYSIEDKVVFYHALVEASRVSIQAPVVDISNSEIDSHANHNGTIEITGLDSTGHGSYGYGNQNDLKISNTKIGVNGSPNAIEVTATERRLFIQNSSQLRALALISLETQNSGDLRVEDSTLLVSQAAGEIVINSAADIHLHNVNMQASTIKASALAANGWLHINASQFTATDLIQFFGNETTGRITFDGGASQLTSPITHMKAATIEVSQGSSVTISGDAYLEATNHDYNVYGKGSINASQLHKDTAPPH